MQKSLLEDSAQEVIEEKEKEKKPSCSFHRWANRDTDFIEVTVKKTGIKIIRCRHCEADKMENKKARLIEWEKEKENVTDYYVKKTLRTGKTGIKSGEIPQELIEAKRALIQLNNLKKKMDEPLKTCSQHGKLFRDDVIRSGKYANGESKWKCKHCMKEMHHKHYQLNKAKVLVSHAKYRQENKEKVKTIKRESWLKHKDKYLKKENERRLRFKQNNIEHYREIDRKRVVELHDNYIKKCLTNHSNIRREDIPDLLIDAKRAIMMLKRGNKAHQQINTKLTLEEKLNGRKD